MGSCVTSVESFIDVLGVLGVGEVQVHVDVLDEEFLNGSEVGGILGWFVQLEESGFMDGIESFFGEVLTLFRDGFLILI